MRKSVSIALCALGVIGSDTALADGPVREGLRNAGQAVAQGARAVAEGAGNVAAGVADAATGRDADRGPNARWRFTRHNGQWWYYTPQNQWMYHRGGQWHAYQQRSEADQVAQAAHQQNVQADQQPEGSVVQAQAQTDVQGAAQLQGQASAQAPQPANPGQPIQQSYQSQRQSYGVARSPSYAGRRYSYGANVSRAPAGHEGNVSSRYDDGRSYAPREINNNPRSATWGAVAR